ncbi:hypothetical protein L596_005753 [Steinernema carpocapsae]|uniref:Uncharacterized protein n=1 Tax=Steinernema carpocapsae TaxID=34508 RepID=A0A4U8V1G6_STECR|nr:hypothetical protein L596_005753 [Steinernema carpocapsae]
MGKTALHDTFNAVQFNPLFSGQFVFGTTTPSNYKTAEHYLKLTNRLQVITKLERTIYNYSDPRNAARYIVKMEKNLNSHKWCPSGINKQDIEIIMWICCYEYKKI